MLPTTPPTSHPHRGMKVSGAGWGHSGHSRLGRLVAPWCGTDPEALLGLVPRGGQARPTPDRKYNMQGVASSYCEGWVDRASLGIPIPQERSAVVVRI